MMFKKIDHLKRHCSDALKHWVIKEVLFLIKNIIMSHTNNIVSTKNLYGDFNTKIE